MRIIALSRTVVISRYRGCCAIYPGTRTAGIIWSWYPVTVPPDDNAEPPEVAAANDSASALAEKLQNPIGNLNSIPLQNNINFNVGPQKGTQDILNIQPVIPFRVTPDLNIITRTILPLVWNPTLQPAHPALIGGAQVHLE